jgi:hypothetical protein
MKRRTLRARQVPPRALVDGRICWLVGGRLIPIVAGGAVDERLRDPASERLEHSVETFESGKAKLHRPDGTPVYGEAEHAERVAGLLGSFDSEAAELTETAREAIEAAERDLARLAGADPLDTLNADELARATALRAFVAEDAETLPAERVAERARAALVRKDRPMALLWLRGIARRLEAGRGRPGGDPGTMALLSVMRELEALFDDPKGAEKRATTRQRIESAKVLMGRVRQARSRVDGSEAAAREQMRQRYRW